jgi:hypothetical protein
MCSPETKQTLQDLVEKSGYYPGGIRKDGTEWAGLNEDTDQQLRDAVGILETAFAKWDIKNTLAFVRAGGSAYDPAMGKDWEKCVDIMQDEHGAEFDEPRKQRIKRDVWKYLSCIKRYLHFIDDQPTLMTDERRPDIECPHIDYLRPST